MSSIINKQIEDNNMNWIEIDNNIPTEKEIWISVKNTDICAYAETNEFGEITDDDGNLHWLSDKATHFMEVNKPKPPNIYGLKKSFTKREPDGSYFHVMIRG